MKKLFLITLAAALLLAACKRSAVLPDYVPYDAVPAAYTLDGAKADGCVVFEDAKITSGQDIWDAFVGQSKSKRPCLVRLAFYYTLDEPERYDPAYYARIKDDYPLLYIQDLEFDGSRYTLSSAEDGESYSFTYKYLKKLTGEPGSPGAAYSKYTFYVLVNDDAVTWEQIERSMLSATAGDAIDHKTVYMNLE